MKLYRLMKLDGDKPKIGTSYGMLGVRPPGRTNGTVVDINVDADGNVHRGEEGLSTFDNPGTPDRKHVVWSIVTDELGPDLAVVPSQDTPGRFHIIPARSMALNAYQDSLAETKDKWIQE